MKILVTGGCGFIGSHLCKRLAMKGFTVNILDNLYSGKIDKLRLNENERKYVKLTLSDIRDFKNVKKQVKDVDVIFHLAAQVSVERSIEKPVFDAETNILGTINLIKSALHNNCRLFVYFSSAAVYGNPENIPVKETHPLKPVSPYGVSKFSGEEYCRMFYRSFNLPIVILRPFNVYGVGQDPDNPYSGVITKFIYNAIDGRELKIFGDGMQTRDFVYVEDVVDVCIKLLETNKSIGETFNVGSGKETSIKELANKIIELCNSKSKINYYPAKVGDIKRSVADISKLKKTLGYMPKTSLSEGLKEIISELRR